MIYRLGECSPQLPGDDYFIADSASVIGNVVLRRDVSVWFGAVLRGDVESITLDEGSNVQDGSILHTDPGLPLQVGPYVTVGHKVVLHGCTVGENSLIGIGAVVLNGAVVGRNCLIGAHSLIPEGKQIPDNSLVIGTPGRVVRTLSGAQIAGLRQSADTYVQNYKRFRRELERL